MGLVGKITKNQLRLFNKMKEVKPEYYQLVLIVREGNGNDLELWTAERTEAEVMGATAENGIAVALDAKYWAPMSVLKLLNQ